ncbi:hypothetical protein MPOCJGCO_3595 [Methylobacterium trifolii]|uniref:Uncharacterized protein n=1 Tax=Methylobacterium trifolii TaxID=1003092 RepID=A0ABQ4U397_9HYPH|nr:hypothetical protein MPOCJGCO_3595 [Methylobacterium trifolii]
MSNLLRAERVVVPQGAAPCEFPSRAYSPTHEIETDRLYSPMWPSNSSGVEIEVEEIYGNTVLARITVPGGILEVLGEVEFAGRELRFLDAHIEGLAPGLVGRRVLNEICRKAMETYDVDGIHIEGATRSTGANPGRRPRTIRFPKGR